MHAVVVAVEMVWCGGEKHVCWCIVAYYYKHRSFPSYFFTLFSIAWLDKKVVGSLEFEGNNREVRVCWQYTNKVGEREKEKCLFHFLFSLHQNALDLYTTTPQ